MTKKHGAPQLSLIARIRLTSPFTELCFQDSWGKMCTLDFICLFVALRPVRPDMQTTGLRQMSGWPVFPQMKCVTWKSCWKMTQESSNNCFVCGFVGGFPRQNIHLSGLGVCILSWCVAVLVCAILWDVQIMHHLDDILRNSNHFAFERNLCNKVAFTGTPASSTEK